MMYSQSDEQYWISSYFGNYIGTFLDLGCNDGIKFSNTYSLVHKGWSGVLVDASPTIFEKLKENLGPNNKLQLLNFGVGKEDGEFPFDESGSLIGDGDLALVSSFKKDQVKRWDSLNIPFETIMVPVKSFKSLMEISKYKTFEFISIDIEGCEIDVVPQINFEELGCRMCIIEWNMIAGELYDTIMLNHGMKCIHVNAENRIYSL